MRGWPLNQLILLLLFVVIFSACGSHVWHSVRKGDTLYSISFRYGQDYKQVAQWNNITPPYIISSGQYIRISAPPPAEQRRLLNQHNSKKVATLVSSPDVEKKASNQAPITSRRYPDNTIIVVTKAAAVKYPKTVKWYWPVQGKIIQFFSTKQPGRKGIDISAKLGTVIKAAASGRVVYAGEGLANYGKLIIIKHNEQFLSAYAHNRVMLIREGQHVEAGTAIAEMGASGTSNVKLHFEVRRKGKPVNPLRYLPKR